MIRLFEIEQGVVKPTEHCKVIKWLSLLEEEYDNYIDIYAYLYYMSAMGEENPFFHVPELERETRILESLNSEIPTEDDYVIDALEKTKSLYETPTLRSYLAVKTVIDKLTDYLNDTEITDGKDGNLTGITKTVKDFNEMRRTFKDVLKDLESEQEHKVRGGQNLAYDQ